MIEIGCNNKFNQRHTSNKLSLQAMLEFGCVMIDFGGWKQQLFAASYSYSKFHKRYLKGEWIIKSPQFQGLGPLKSSLILVIHTFTDKSMCNEKFVSAYKDRRSEKYRIENYKTNNGSNGSIRHHNRAIIRTYMRHSTIAYVLCF